MYYNKLSILDKYINMELENVKKSFYGENLKVCIIIIYIYIYIYIMNSLIVITCYSMFIFTYIIMFVIYAILNVIINIIYYLIIVFNKDEYTY